jgi:signal transduction histidine kinase
MGRDYNKNTYNIEPVDIQSGTEMMTPEEKANAIDIGNTTDEDNVSLMIENALVVLSIEKKFFSVSKLDSIIRTSLNDDGSIVSSNIILQDVKENIILDQTSSGSPPASTNFIVTTYTANRIIDSPTKSFLIKAEYGIRKPGYLPRLGVMTVASIITSTIIIFVLFYLTYMLRKRYKEINNMRHSFHGAIHDLKSPLASAFFILSTLEEAEIDINKKVSLSTASDRISYLTDKIMRLLKSSKDFDRIGETDKQNIYLYDILEQIEDEMLTMFPKKKINFINNLDSELILRILPDLFEAALRIIIENAVKYCDVDPEIEISSIRDVNNIKIVISDNGVGMTKRQLKNIFKPYYTSDKISGTGIGLYYARSIIKLHSGNISVESTVGKGSSFIITIPI